MIMLLIIAGYVLALGGVSRVLSLVNNFLFYITLPGIIFLSIVRISSVEDFLIMLCVSLIHMSITFVVSYCGTRFVIKDMVTRLTMTTSLVLANSVFLAIPLATLMYGEPTTVLPYSIAFNIYLAPFIFFVTIKTGRMRGGGGNLSNYLKSLPHLMAFIIALTLRLTEPGLGLKLDTAFTLLSYTNYSSFLIIGGQLARLRLDYLKRSLGRLLLPFTIKYVISPIAALTLYVFAASFKQSLSAFFPGLMIQSVMSPAVSTVVIAEVHKLESDFATLLIALMTPISIALAVIAGLTLAS